MLASTFALYLSQKGEMLNDQMCALGLPSATLSADDDALKGGRSSVILQTGANASVRESPARWSRTPLQTRYLVFAGRHHAPVGCIGRGEDVRWVVGPLHAVVELRELTRAERDVKAHFRER